MPIVRPNFTRTTRTAITQDRIAEQLKANAQRNGAATPDDEAAVAASVAEARDVAIALHGKHVIPPTNNPYRESTRNVTAQMDLLKRDPRLARTLAARAGVPLPEHC